MNRRLAALIIPAAATLIAVFHAGAAHAEAGLQLNPLKYEDIITDQRVKTGHIDVANPSDTTVTIKTSVQGFRQYDLDGNLQFFTDDNLSAGITPGLDQFELGPRESIRVTFNVDPGKLPQGGVYAAIFFRTVPPTPAADTSYISEAANVGTLLMLQNGVGRATGEITALKLPFWQLGPGLTGRLQYHNTNQGAHGLAFSPQLTSTILPWSKPAKLAGPFIMAGSSRQFAFVRPGNYFGLLPVTITDTTSGRHVTRWIIACTGNYQLLVVLLVIFVMVWLFARWRGWNIWEDEKPAPSPAIDGLSSSQN